MCHFLPVRETIAVCVRVIAFCPVNVHLVPVVKEVGVGITAQWIATVLQGLGSIEQSVPIRVRIIRCGP